MTTIAKWKSMCSITCRIKQCIYNDLTALKFTTDNQSNYQLLKDLDRRTICFHGCFSGEPHVVSSSLSSFLYLLWNRTPESKWCSLYRLQLHAIPVTNQVSRDCSKQKALIPTSACFILSQPTNGFLMKGAFSLYATSPLPVPHNQVVKVIWHKGCIAATDRRFNRIRKVVPMCPPMKAHWRQLANTIELVLTSAHPSP